MRQLIILLLFLVVSVWFGLTVLKHPGYVLLVYQPWLVQMPLWFAVLALLVFLGVFYVLVDGLDRLGFLWFRFKNWLKLRREYKFYSKTQQGLTNYIEAYWKKAEKLLLAGANQAAEPLVNYLAAARAANELGAYGRADSHLQQALKTSPSAELAIGLTHAELQMKRHLFAEAATTLQRLHKQSPRHPRVLKLLEKVYVREGDWQRLRDLLPDLRKAKLINSEQATQFEKNIYCEIFNVAHSYSLPALHQAWDNTPRAMRKQPEVICAYINCLQSFGTTQAEIEELIRKTLRQTWMPELARIYAGIPFDNLNRQLVIAGAWLKIHGDQPELLLMLGKLCAKLQLWGKAGDYFERCLAVKPDAEAALDYGTLLEQLGKTDQAIQVYHQALAGLAGKANK